MNLFGLFGHLCWNFGPAQFTAFLLFDSCRFRQLLEDRDSQRSARRSSVDFAVSITEPKEDILEIWESEKKQWKQPPSCHKAICNLELEGGFFPNKNLRVVQDNAILMMHHYSP